MRPVLTMFSSLITNPPPRHLTHSRPILTIMTRLSVSTRLRHGVYMSRQAVAFWSMVCRFGLTRKPLTCLSRSWSVQLLPGQQPLRHAPDQFNTYLDSHFNLGLRPKLLFHSDVSNPNCRYRHSIGYPNLQPHDRRNEVRAERQWTRHHQ
jgi:hypothetical protein